MNQNICIGQQRSMANESVPPLLADLEFFEKYMVVGCQSNDVVTNY